MNVGDQMTLLDYQVGEIIKVKDEFKDKRTKRIFIRYYLSPFGIRYICIKKEYWNAYIFGNNCNPYCWQEAKKHKGKIYIDINIPLKTIILR